MRSITLVAGMVAALAVSLSAGCGGSDGLANDGGGKNLQLFIGTWHITSGTETLTCAGQAQTVPIGDTVWQAGTTSDLLQPADSSGCTLRANVSGSTAIAVPGQSCIELMGGTTLTLTVASYMFTVGASGTTATESGSGNAVANGTTSVSCTFTENATLTKAP